MSQGKVFLVGSQEAELLPMDETPYAREDILQELLERYPDLLAGDQITPEEPRRWLLIKREAGVPAEEGGSDHWSLDHLFVDQDGVPTFVECKRATDTRGRREVVAQMLDYAANGTAYWGIDRIRQDAAETAQASGRTLDEAVQTLLGADEMDEDAVEAFWHSVEENLREGRVRLVFVSDHTPRPLRRLVEFMNEKMADVEVLAVEVQQYVGGAQKVVVPRVIGMTEATRSAKARSSTSRTPITAEEVIERSTPAAAAEIRRLLDETEARGLTIYWGTTGFSVRRQLRASVPMTSFAYIYPPNRFELYLKGLSADPARAEEIRSSLLALGEFEEGGAYTLRVYVAEATRGLWRNAWATMLAALDQIAEREWEVPLP